MLETGEDLPFAAEVPYRLVAGGPGGDDLDRDPLAVLVVGAGGEVDHAHAAVAEFAQHPVGTDPPVDPGVGGFPGLSLGRAARRVAAGHEGPYVTPGTAFQPGKSQPPSAVRADRATVTGWRCRGRFGARWRRSSLAWASPAPSGPSRAERRVARAGAARPGARRHPHHRLPAQLDRRRRTRAPRTRAERRAVHRRVRAHGRRRPAGC